MAYVPLAMPSLDQSRTDTCAATSVDRWYRWTATSACLLVLLAVVVWQVVGWARQGALAELHDDVEARAGLYRAAIVAELGKFKALPTVLSLHRDIAEALARPAAAAAAANHVLEAAAEQAGASVIYLMDKRGLTLAASNWNRADSFVGQDFSYRPYFQEALAGRHGSYFALGSSSVKPGYYLSVPVELQGKVAGALVVKLSLETLEARWRGGSDRVAVTDEEGVILATNVPAWRFQVVRKLRPEVERRIRDSLQFGQSDLAPLPVLVWRREGEVDVAVLKEGARAVPLIAVSAPMPETGWSIRVFADTEVVDEQAAQWGAIAALGGVLLGLAALALAWRTMRLRERLAADGEARAELERRVRERTAALETTNDLMRQEVADHRRTEQELRETQSELVQATKLAALGQMSASLAHELNQPLAAIRTFADNAQTLLDRQRFDDVRGNLGQIGELTERMGRIASHLKIFARRSSGEIHTVAVGAVLAQAVSLVEPRLRALRASLHQALPAEEVWVQGEEVRLGQVLLNLLQNAIDAVAEAPERRVTVTVGAEDEEVVIAIADTGPGIPPHQMAYLFKPFFTTKAPGQGLGLGLSISKDIIQDLGGSVTCTSEPEAGATFVIRLKRAAAP